MDQPTAGGATTGDCLPGAGDADRGWAAGWAGSAGAYAGAWAACGGPWSIRRKSAFRDAWALKSSLTCTAKMRG